MSSSFSANQYEGTFKSSRLQNWCLPKEFKERPTARGGHTTFIANDQGHLLPRIKRGSAWPDYKGTWDLPDRIPGHHVYPTSRSAIGVNRQKTWDFDPQDAGKSRQQGGITSPDELADDGERFSENVQQDCAPTSSADKARPASQYLLVNEGVQFECRQCGQADQETSGKRSPTTKFLAPDNMSSESEGAQRKSSRNSDDPQAGSSVSPEAASASVKRKCQC